MPVGHVSRRDVVRMSLLGGVVATLAGCTTSSGTGPISPSPGGPQDPDRALREQAAADQQRMSALYAAADVRAVEAAAVAALGARHSSYAKAINPSAFNAEPSASQGNNSGQPTSTSPTEVASATPTSDVPILGLSGLRKAELASSASLVKQAAKAADPELARIIVLAAAGSAAAAEALRMVSYARG